MNGIFIIDKPAGITSHDVVARVRRILKTRRVGHTGTLDPFATGVMVILVGKATRLAQFLDKDIKEYEAIVRFGFETDTGDRTGMRIADCGLRNEEMADLLDKTNWRELLSGFTGQIDQIPPMYSAKKIKGKKLYEFARKGIEIERQAVTITIYELELANAPTPLLSEEGCPKGGVVADGLTQSDDTIAFRILCSAGAYIRTLAEDIGRKLGVGAHLAELRRTRAGRFDLSRALTLDKLEGIENPAAALIPMDEAVANLPEFMLDADRIEKTRNGLSSRYQSDELQDGQPVRMISGDGSLIAVGFYNETEKAVQPKVVLI